MDVMKSEITALRDQLTGILIGIARAVDGNEHLISDSTDKIVREGLAATFFGTDLRNDLLTALIQRAEDEKRNLIPNCYECASPCGKNSDYDMRRLWDADKDVCSCRAAALGHTDQEVNRFFYQALFAVGEESFGVQELLPIAMEFGKVNLRCEAPQNGAAARWLKGGNEMIRNSSCL